MMFHFGASWGHFNSNGIGLTSGVKMENLPGKIVQIAGQRFSIAASLSTNFKTSRQRGCCKCGNGFCSAWTVLTSMLDP